ncbi:MAG: tRNA adenosine(34) deaminase TadA [Desulfobulbaceae bacterium]|nr:tRNA adenosine(34) deaminase TadA [Desulfobulbaceae bacterium]
MNALDEQYMEIALSEARRAAERGEVPVGAVVVDPSLELLASDGNRTIELADPSAHAEMLALRAAGIKLGNYRLTGCTLYVTLEPCVMCAGAMVHARIGRLVYGATDPKTGAIESVYKIGGDGRLNHNIKAEGGVLATEASALLREFFRARRTA